ncbi:DUF1189 domain-containing protein [Jeotgalibaca sp. MA1X17-3]|uniref:DUF1189 family protein n=1 Tax=Jeotgalibaca sp. MA1X17-3 TaxID=2908211 RepID=UPI001F3D17CC|nr:DUF1189 family protein [Jeotgalibaca sp. MA1X17-3]UJF14896.1 DUF1189 domain-containing protein [Jeotgalibaca sp. MA1X17-3]
MIIISLYTLLFNSFLDPSHLWKATELKRKKTVYLFLLTSLIVGIPFFISNMNAVATIEKDISRVTTKIPAFVIEDGTVNVKDPLEKALVVRTDSLNFIFDIHNQYDELEKEKDVENTILNLLFTEDSFTLLTNQVPINIPYENADGFTDEFFTSLLSRFSTKNTITVITMIVLSFLSGMFEAAIRLLLFTIIGNLVSALFRIRLPFSVNWKIMMVASFVPTILFSLLNSVLIFPYGQTGIIGVISAFLYYKGIKIFIEKQIK